ncbi:MAG: hypothetical protein R3F61_34495 [Myxococcota bacterium]
MTSEDTGISELERISGEYRKAFDTVQRLLATLDLGTVPPYVFAIDKFDVKDLGALSPQLARVEQRRRQWRAALHAMAELTALQDGKPTAGADVLATFDPDAESGDLSQMAASADGMEGLDRFISVVQYARTVGCMYVDGGFQPVFKGSDR